MATYDPDSGIWSSYSFDLFSFYIAPGSSAESITAQIGGLITQNTGALLELDAQIHSMGGNLQLAQTDIQDHEERLLYLEEFTPIDTAARLDALEERVTILEAEGGGLPAVQIQQIIETINSDLQPQITNLQNLIDRLSKYIADNVIAPLDQLSTSNELFFQFINTIAKHFTPDMPQKNADAIKALQEALAALSIPGAEISDDLIDLITAIQVTHQTDVENILHQITLTEIEPTVTMAWLITDMLLQMVDHEKRLNVIKYDLQQQFPDLLESLQTAFKSTKDQLNHLAHNVKPAIILDPD